MPLLYTNQNQLESIRVPLAFQVAAARDYCNRQHLKFSMAHDEIIGSKAPIVFNTLLSSRDGEAIFLPSDWFLLAMMNQYDLSMHIDCKKDVAYYLQNGTAGQLGREIMRLSSISLKNIIAFY
ncbi:hypothetical protein OAT10_02510 [Luminiphilus sp.]|nr:hypothetical protein [Luminiphilus sp.]